MRKQRPILEDHSHVSILGRDPAAVTRNDPIGDLAGSLIGPLKTCHEAQQRGLTAAAWPQQCKSLAWLDCERHIRQNHGRVKAFVQVADSNRTSA